MSKTYTISTEFRRPIMLGMTNILSAKNQALLKDWKGRVAQDFNLHDKDSILLKDLQVEAVYAYCDVTGYRTQCFVLSVDVERGFRWINPLKLIRSVCHG